MCSCIMDVDGSLFDSYSQSQFTDPAEVSENTWIGRRYRENDCCLQHLTVVMCELRSKYDVVT